MNPEQMIPSQPNDTNKPDNRMDNPETGDGSNLTLPIIILSVSGIGLLQEKVRLPNGLRKKKDIYM